MDFSYRVGRARGQEFKGLVQGEPVTDSEVLLVAFT